MDEVKKKDLKSIVARRLVLFSALERGRPRSDDGCPVAYSQDQFIYNTGLSQEIVSDFQKTLQSKSANLKDSSQSIFTDANGEILADMATGKLNLKETRNEPLSPRNRESPSNGLNNIPRQDSEEASSAFSVRQLRSIFETSTVTLTARNSSEERRPSPIRNFRIASIARDGDSHENGSQNRSGNPQNRPASPQHRRSSPNLTPKRSVTSEPSPSALLKDVSHTVQSKSEDRPSTSEITDAGLSKASPPAFRKDSAQYRPASPQNRPASPQNRPASPQQRRSSPNLTPKRSVTTEPSALLKDVSQNVQSISEDRPSTSENAGLSRASPPAFRKDSAQYRPASPQNRPRSPIFNAKRELFYSKQSPSAIRKDSTQNSSCSSQNRPHSPQFDAKRELSKNKQSPPVLRKNSSQEIPGSPGLSKKIPLLPPSSPNAFKKPVPHPSDFQNMTKNQANASRSSTLPIEREPLAVTQSSKTLPHLGTQGKSVFYFPYETGVDDASSKSPAKKIPLTPPTTRPPKSPNPLTPPSCKPPKSPSPLTPPVCKPPMPPNRKESGDLGGIRDTPTSKPLPKLTNYDNIPADDGKQKDEEPSGTLRRNSPVICRRVIDNSCTGSVYVDAGFKIEDGEEKPPEIPVKVPTGPIKQRTLGRGAIKPYEIVELVSTGGDSKEESQWSKEEITETSKPTRMESMYVETFGNSSQKNGGKEYETITEEEDGYQKIPDYSEPENAKFTRLESNEFDLSNLDSNDNAVGSKLTESLLNPDDNLNQGSQDYVANLAAESNPNPTDSAKYDMADDEGLGEYAEPETNESDLHADDSRFSTLSSEISYSLYGNSSTLSDLFEGWDSDEFDDLTDDEILETKSHRKMTTDADAAKKKIWNIVNEILATEKAYEKRLHLLDKVFQDRLLKESKENSIVPEKVIQEIFSNLSSIYTFHSTMLRPDLEKRISNWSANEKIGDIFKTLGHCLKLYTDYVKNFDHATTTLTQWMKKSPKFAAVIEELQKRPECEHLSLQHHMLEPIQRVPRYKMLLQDYLKKLPKDSSDRAEAEEALVVISEAANHSNNSMKGMDQFKKLVEIEERIVDGLRGESIATASRIFIKEGELVKIAARSDQRQTRVLLLFNDLLLCCNKVPPTGKLKVRQMMDIPGMTLQDGDEEVDVGEQHAFRIRSRQRVLDLAASNPEEKNEWIKAIDKVIKDFEAKRGTLLKQHVEEEAQRDVERTGSMTVGESAPVWVKDEDVTMCMLCAIRFSLLSRRHHCRACGRIVCDNCSKYKAQLGYMNNTVKRVCYVCHKKLNADNLQETDSFIQKSVTLSKVNKDPKRRWSKMVAEVKGELMWKPPGKGWTRGWFIVSDMVLFVQKGKRDPKAQMTIALPGYSVTKPKSGDEDFDSKHPMAFKLHFGNKKELTYYFKADNEELTQKWLDVLMYSVKAEKPPPSYKTL